MLRLAAKLVLVGALLIGASPGCATEVFRGISLPLELGGFKRGVITNNEDRSPGLGVTVAYSAPGIKASVFIYDLGIKQLADGLANADVHAQSTEALRDIAVVHSSLSILEALAPAPSPCTGFLRAKVSYIERGDASNEPMHSYLYLGIRRGSFVKVRLSYYAGTAFVTGVASEARFTSALCASVNR